MRARLLGLVLAAALAAWSPASAAAPPGWDELEAPPLTFHHPTSHAELARRLALRGPSELARISAALGLPAPPHVDVIVAPRQARVDPSQWGLPLGPEWAAGIALTDRPVIVLRGDEDAGPYGNEAATVLSHELVHSVMSQALGARHGALPAWLREGVASYLSFDWRFDDSADTIRFALGGSYVPLTSLDAAFPHDGWRAHGAYLESFAFVRWLAEEHGAESLRQLFRRIDEGQDFHAAFRATYRDSPRGMEERWRRGFLWRYRWVPVLTGTTTLWLVVAVLVVAAWLRRRRLAQARLALWEAEEIAVSAAPPGDDE